MARPIPGAILIPPALLVVADLNAIHYMLTGLQNFLRTRYAKIRIEVFNSDLILSRDLFEDKRVIIVGPAESSLTYMRGPEIDEFDIVVRINSSPIQLTRFSERIGGRTDVLFHSFFENGDRGTGRIELEHVLAQKTGYIVCPITDRKYYKFLLNQRRQLKQRLTPVDGLTIAITPLETYDELKRRLDGTVPTTGLLTIAFLLGCKIRELHITGFTFFAGKYVPGYRDTIQTLSDIQNWIANSIHDPQKERLVFKQMYESAVDNKKRVVLDSVLMDIVDEIQRTA